MSKFFTENSLTLQNQSGFKPDYSCTNQPGLILTTYCVRYPHAVPFLRNEIPFFLLKPPKTHAVLGSVACPEFGKMRGKDPQLCPFTGLSCPFLAIPHACLYFLE